MTLVEWMRMSGAQGEFDCISVYPSVGHCVVRDQLSFIEPTLNSNQQVHNCQMQADMVRMFIRHEDFVANATFDEVISGLMTCS